MNELEVLRTQFKMLENLLHTYQQDCANANAELNQRLTRIMTAALGDEQMGVIGFVELHRRQHQDVLKEIGAVLDAQIESSRHRVQHANLPLEVIALKKEVADLQQKARDIQTTEDAYKRMVTRAIVGINIAWTVGVAAWKLLA